MLKIHIDGEWHELIGKVTGSQLHTFRCENDPFDIGIIMEWKTEGGIKWNARFNPDGKWVGKYNIDTL